MLHPQHHLGTVFGHQMARQLKNSCHAISKNCSASARDVPTALAFLPTRHRASAVKLHSPDHCVRTMPLCPRTCGNNAAGVSVAALRAGSLIIVVSEVDFAHRTSFAPSVHRRNCTSAVSGCHGFCLSFICSSSGCSALSKTRASRLVVDIPPLRPSPQS